jgi:hypothetical protein
MNKVLRTFLAAWALLFATSASVSGGDGPEQATTTPVAKHYLLVFGADSCPKRARFSHTWATIVQATPDDQSANGYRLESQTISWMPASLRIRPLALRPERGVNLSLGATLNDCFCKGERVALWGPYEFDPEPPPGIWARVQTQIARLNSACMLYKALDPDTGSRSKYVSNCIHAVTDLDPHLPRPAYNELRDFGLDASRHLIRIIASRHDIDPDITHSWVADALGLDSRVRRQTLRMP